MLREERISGPEAPSVLLSPDTFRIFTRLIFNLYTRKLADDNLIIIEIRSAVYRGAAAETKLPKLRYRRDT